MKYRIRKLSISLSMPPCLCLKSLLSCAVSSAHIIPDGLNKLADVNILIVRYCGLTTSTKHPEQECPLGHGKSENLAISFSEQRFCILRLMLFWIFSSFGIEGKLSRGNYRALPFGYAEATGGIYLSSPSRNCPRRKVTQSATASLKDRRA